MDDHERVREAQRTAWAGLAAGWEKWDAVIMDQLRPVTSAMVDALGVTEQHRDLDVASGTGEPGLAIAALAPRGRVVLTDLSSEMLDVARRRAHAQGITNIATTVCSGDDLPFDDASFDSVSVRFGYMFLPDLPAAAAEQVRVLRPGGRLCTSVWVRPEDNPWTTIVTDAIASEVPLPPPDPRRPHMYRCAQPGAVSGLLRDAGLRDVEERDVPVELVTRSTREYWDMISEHVSLAAAMLAQVDTATRDRVAAEVVRSAARYDDGTAVRIPGLARVVVGTR